MQDSFSLKTLNNRFDFESCKTLSDIIEEKSEIW